MSAVNMEALLERTRKFVQTHCIPSESNEHLHNPAALDATLSILRPLAQDAGLYLPNLPISWGGLGLSWSQRALLLEEAGKSYLGPAAMNCAAPDQPNMISLLAQGTPEQQEQYLRPLAAGQIRSCFAMTEPAPGAGSDPSMLQTTARKTATGWVIDGHKWFITGAIGASFAIVLAQTEHGPSQFIVPMDTPGMQVVRAIHSSDPFAIGGHAELRLQGCEVPDSAILGELGRGFDYAQQRLEPARLSHCMRLMGRARRSLELAQDYVNERMSFGSTLAQLQQIQAMVADSHIELYACRLMVRDCAARMDEERSVKTESAMAKVFVSEALHRIADRAAQMTGAYGMDEAAPIALIARELRPFRIYDGASELHRATLGRRFLKHKA